MGKTTLKALGAAALVGLTVLTMAAPAEAGRGHGHGRGGWDGGGRHYRHHDNGIGAFGAGLLGFGVGAIVGSALTPREVYVAPPPPPPAPAYYGPASYGPPPWTPDWYSYCYSLYRSFNPRTGTYLGYDGYEHFCR
jgi:hypothetical protein